MPAELADRRFRQTAYADRKKRGASAATEALSRQPGLEAPLRYLPGLMDLGPLLFAASIAALSVAAAREVRRTLFAYKAGKSGLTVLAIAPLGRLDIIAIEPPSALGAGSGGCPDRTGLKGARLVRVTAHCVAPVSPDEVWDLTRRLRFLWYPPNRFGASRGFGSFLAFLRANPLEHRHLLDEVERALVKGRWAF